MDALKKDIRFYLKYRDTESLETRLSELEVPVLTELLGELSRDEKVLIFRLLEKEKALKVFEHSDLSLQKELLYSFTATGEREAEKMFEELGLSSNEELFDELPAEISKELVSSLSVEERNELSLLMGYKKESAGKLMTPEYIAVSRDSTAEEILKIIRKEAGRQKNIYVVYIIDEKRRLEGVLSLRDLVAAELDVKAENLMREPVTKVTTEADQEAAARILQKMNFVALPVVDQENRLAGIITFDKAMKILEQETTEDIYYKAGLRDADQDEEDRSEKMIKGSLWQIWKVRLPFLLIAMIGGILAGFVIDEFEQILEAVTATAIFIPVIMDMGGNVGTQSSTIFSRGLVTGHIEKKDFLKHLAKETQVGLSMGIVVGLAVGVIAAIWQGIPRLGLAVGLALAITMTLASVLGFLTPYLLNQLDMDQAAGADPIITTIKDVLGLIIYFVLVSYLLT